MMPWVIKAITTNWLKDEMKNSFCVTTTLTHNEIVLHDLGR